MSARRRSGLRDLVDLASQLPWALSLILSPITFIVLTLVSRHYLAAATFSPPYPDIAAPVVSSFYGSAAAVARWLVALTFLLGAAMSWWKKRHRIALLSKANQNPAEIEHLCWQDFERLIGQAYHQQGYSVTEIGGRGPDGGVDLVLQRDGLETLVQCKQWRQRRVGVSTIRELHGVVAQRRAAGGVVVTLGGFTSEAQEFAKESNIRLLDWEAVQVLLSGVDAGELRPQKRSDSLPTSIPACCRCGATMVQRVARQGPHKGEVFFGCSRYPQCRQISPVATPKVTFVTAGQRQIEITGYAGGRPRS